ncbi:uncharacterized protein LY89DRAFT_732314 [Mollisia scopiformis]|uniref:Uncharacterized protein n=1 Tax=Mollisia scopiformis TaxID=149040 RepID=A0A194XF25_MOLSC|nr:uncharacterized protein LY89DRAFT_732314 [Mollisia scopiformis]KUJ18768.1 hypothetical protein LY89DRAFT_732314 [Mollisia scopiformis]
MSFMSDTPLPLRPTPRRPCPRCPHRLSDLASHVEPAELSAEEEVKTIEGHATSESEEIPATTSEFETWRDLLEELKGKRVPACDDDQNNGKQPATDEAQTDPPIYNERKKDILVDMSLEHLDEKAEAADKDSSGVAAIKNKDVPIRKGILIRARTKSDGLQKKKSVRFHKGCKGDDSFEDESRGWSPVPCEYHVEMDKEPEGNEEGERKPVEEEEEENKA